VFRFILRRVPLIYSQSTFDRIAFVLLFKLFADDLMCHLSRCSTVSMRSDGSAFEPLTMEIASFAVLTRFCFVGPLLFLAEFTFCYFL